MRNPRARITFCNDANVCSMNCFSVALSNLQTQGGDNVFYSINVSNVIQISNVFTNLKLSESLSENCFSIMTQVDTSCLNYQDISFETFVSSQNCFYGNVCHVRMGPTNMTFLLVTKKNLACKFSCKILKQH